MARRAGGHRPPSTLASTARTGARTSTRGSARGRSQPSTVADVRRLVSELREAGKATATVRRVLQVLSLIYADAVEERLALANPVAALPRRDRKAIRQVRRLDGFPVLDDAQVRSLIASTPKRYRLLVSVAVMTGLRQGELLGLRWQDVTRDGDGQPVLRVRLALVTRRRSWSSLRLRPPFATCRSRSTSRGRSPSTGSRSRERSADTDYVFATATGTPLHYRNLARRALDPAQEAAKLPERLTWHDLRHVAASVLIGGGASVVYVSRTLGHSNPVDHARDLLAPVRAGRARRPPPRARGRAFAGVLS